MTLAVLFVCFLSASAARGYQKDDLYSRHAANLGSLVQVQNVQDSRHGTYFPHQHVATSCLLQMATALLLLLALAMSSRLSPLSEKKEQRARRAIEVQNAQFSRPVGRAVHAFVGLLLLPQLLKGVSSVCSYTTNSVTATVDASGNMVIPKEWTSVPHNAFYSNDCKDTLKYVTFEEPSQVTSIGNNAFRQDTSLVSIFLPASLNHIYSYAFRDCMSPLVVFNCAGAVTLNMYAFRWSGVPTIYVPAGSDSSLEVNVEKTLECCPAGKYSSTGGNQAGCMTNTCNSGCSR